MKNTFRHILFSRYTLLGLSIISFALSFVFNSYYTRVSAINHEKRSLTRYIQKQELNFNEVVKDTHLLRKLVQNKETLDEFKSLEEKDYGIYKYRHIMNRPLQNF